MSLSQLQRFRSYVASGALTVLAGDNGVKALQTGTASNVVERAQISLCGQSEKSIEIYSIDARHGALGTVRTKPLTRAPLRSASIPGVDPVHADGKRVVSVFSSINKKARSLRAAKRRFSATIRLMWPPISAEKFPIGSFLNRRPPRL